jgi:hypothetical protein
VRWRRSADLCQNDAIDLPSAELRQIGVDAEVAEDPAAPRRTVDDEERGAPCEAS